MKVYRTISRALLLVLMLSPLSLRALGVRVSSPSCRAPHRAAKQPQNNRTANSPYRAVLTAASPNTPNQRAHRLRGKRINLDAANVPAGISVVAVKESSPRTALPIQERSGPNPPRAPPAV